MTGQRHDDGKDSWLHDDDLATTRQTVRYHHEKKHVFLPVRRHDFGSLVEGDAYYFFGFCDMICMTGPGKDFKLKDMIGVI